MKHGPQNFLDKKNNNKSKINKYSNTRYLELFFLTPEGYSGAEIATAIKRHSTVAHARTLLHG